MHTQQLKIYAQFNYNNHTFVPEGGTRGRGRPRQRFYDTIKEDLAVRGITTNTRNQQAFWKHLSRFAEDRSTWRNNVVNAQ